MSYTYYKFEAKKHPTTGTCKIIRHKFDKKTNKLIRTATILKNVCESDADNILFQLSRGLKIETIIETLKTN